ncbi:MAG: hypothetical protein GY851_01505 [bacterium]|nr:hypothetical protein [bacterium]
MCNASRTSIHRLAALAALLLATTANAATYYVAADGADANDGTSPATAWRTLPRVNNADLKSGDSLLFRRGDAWRGQLSPQSGDETGPITYGAYGEGPKPMLMGSVEANDPAEWRHEGGSTWATGASGDDGPDPSGPEILPNPTFEAGANGWHLHREAGASVSASRDTEEFDTAPAGYRVTCTAPGERSNHIQLYAGPFAVRAGTLCLLTFRAKSSAPFTMAAPRLMKSGPPWTTYARVSGITQEVTDEWATFSWYYSVRADVDDARLTFFLGGILPENASLYLDSLSLRPCQTGHLLASDVGNIILDHEASCGVKVWNAADMKEQGQYWYDEDNFLLKLYSERNPGEYYQDIELALREHIIPQSGCSYVVYENLAVLYGAAHGIGGASTHHIVVRDCDFGYIGGGDQMGGDRTVRFGNGVEFWANAHDCLVERCRFWEIYDAALTNQSNGAATRQVNIVYRDNLIWNCEYSFEYWNRPEDSLTQEVYFENNTCFNAGHGWGHAQRSDPSGRHLCFYTAPAQLDGFYVRNNIFVESTKNGLYAPGWTPEQIAALTMDNNCWFQAEGVLMNVAGKSYTAAEFAQYQADWNQERNSFVADPKVVDAAAHDYGLREGSPCIDAAVPSRGRTGDFARTPVPQGAAPDIGAHEFEKQ